jgi:uncharacterized repeat protein (TIGR03803 family)
MRDKNMVRIILGILAIVAVTSMLAGAAWAQATFKTLHKFTGGADGNIAEAGLIFDQVGNLYGTTLGGGAQGLGTVFQLTPNKNGGWAEHVLHSFCSRTYCADGANPFAGLIFDQAGNLYGTTSGGGAHGNNGGGTVFRLAPSQNGGWTESVLYSFCSLANCADGAAPAAGLIFDQAGNLYGTTPSGGAHNNGGTVFQLAPNQNGGWTEHTLYSFCSQARCTDGLWPFAGLTFDQVGNLYGTTSRGGAHSQGTVFQLTPKRNGSWAEHVLHSFCPTNCADGAIPAAGLIFDQAGNLYGTTGFGGAHDWGIAFQLTPNQNGWTEHVLHNFCCAYGVLPAAGLIFDLAGNLYGTTSKGTQGWGTTFQLTPSQNGGWTPHVLHSFVDKPNAQPAAGLILDKAGNLYGTTAGDGSTTFGSVFEITP